MLFFFLFSPLSFLNKSVQDRLGGAEQGDVCSRVEWEEPQWPGVVSAARAEWVGRVVTQHGQHWVLQETGRLVT